jgi:hypothetical protein
MLLPRVLKSKRKQHFLKRSSCYGFKLTLNAAVIFRENGRDKNTNAVFLLPGANASA